MLLRAGDVARAEPHIERALSLFEQAEVETGKAQLLLSLAELLLAKRDLATAESVAREAVALAERHHETGTTSDGHYWLAQVALARDDQQAADVEFAASLADPDDGGWTNFSLREGAVVFLVLIYCAAVFGFYAFILRHILFWIDERQKKA